MISKAIKAISISILGNFALLVALKPQGSHWETICCNVSGKLEDCSCVCWPRLVDAHIALLLLSASAGRRALEQWVSVFRRWPIWGKTWAQLGDNLGSTWGTNLGQLCLFSAGVLCQRWKKDPQSREQACFADGRQFQIGRIGMAISLLFCFSVTI